MEMENAIWVPSFVMPIDWVRPSDTDISIDSRKGLSLANKFILFFAQQCAIPRNSSLSGLRNAADIHRVIIIMRYIGAQVIIPSEEDVIHRRESCQRSIGLFTLHALHCELPSSTTVPCPFPFCSNGRPETCALPLPQPLCMHCLTCYIFEAAIR